MFVLRIFVGGLLVLLSATPTHASEQPVIIRILRQHTGPDCSSGQMSVNNVVVGYTLERPWQGNLPLISSIPARRYKAFLRTATASRWRIELKDVPGRSNVQIHVGNFTVDTTGCILLGPNLSPGLCSLSAGSAKTFDRFKLEINKAAAKQGKTDLTVPIEVVIEDQ